MIFMKYVCITDLMRRANDISNTSIKLSDIMKYPYSSYVIRSYISSFGVDIKDKSITLMDLKRGGFAKRIGKGRDQKWFVDFNVAFMLLSLSFGKLAYDLLYDDNLPCMS